MTALYGREWALMIGQPGGVATEYTGMRLRFDSRLGGSSASHGTKITYWMPPKGLIGQLGTADTLVRVLAGYVDGGAVEVARGTVVRRSVKDRRGSADPHVEWQVHHSSKALTPLLCFSLDGPVSASEVIEHIRDFAGIPAGIIDLKTDPVFARGYVLSGSVRQALEDMALTTGSQMSLSDGRLRMWPRGTAAQRLVDLWSASTGLVDLSGPSDKNRISARALLRPALRPGDTVRLSDATYSGDVTVIECSHQGDSEGRDWYTSIVGSPL